ncbi:MAG TPA: TonB-dependent receptor [Caulobacteraceae bacterium]|jgi:outer membrane receptor protein involved in Fe transport|nr:TonB-dependent receptor [Caulobacteraceae bacterium]
MLFFQTRGKFMRTFCADWRLAALLTGVSLSALASTIPGVAAAADQSPPSPAVQVEEVVVTAQKRTESIHDVPMSVSAISGATLENASAFRLEDYVGKLPGVTLIDTGAAGNQVVIRGVSMGETSINASVASYLDESPFTIVGPFSNSNAATANLDTFDLARVEVLRGPQGTLYGASALGGLIKYVTSEPQLGHYAARIEAGISSVDGGATGGDVHAMVNVPIGDTTALRLVGYDTDYPGYVSDPKLGKDINTARFAGARALILFEPNANLKIRFSALYQKRDSDEQNSIEVAPGTLKPVYGDLTTDHAIRQPSSVTNQLYNVLISYDFGPATFLSSSSYGDYDFADLFDESADYAALLDPILGAPYGIGIIEKDNVKFFTQEFRLTSPSSGRLRWQIGGFYNQESANEFEQLDAANGSRLDASLTPNIGAFVVKPAYTEYAAFADVDYFLSDTFDVQLGGRYSSNHQSFHEVGTGILAGPGEDFGTRSSQGVFTYSADARWKVSPGTMLYARVATGFVPGGPNDVIPGSPFPSSYSSSTTTNYEAGVKSQFLDGKLSTELSAFDVEWGNIQLEAFFNGLGTITNGGTARSRGVEFSTAWAPSNGLNIAFNGAYTDARLTQSAPASVNANAGETLPAVAKWAGSVSADYRRPVFNDATAFLGGDIRFSARRYADFSAVGPRQALPGYDLVDLRGGLEIGKYKVELYVKNVADKRVVNYVIPNTLSGGFGDQMATIYQPRTFGAMFTADF